MDKEQIKKVNAISDKILELIDRATAAGASRSDLQAMTEALAMNIVNGNI